MFGYMSSFAIVIGAAFLVPAIMYGLARLGRMTLRRRLGVEGLLAHANLTSAIPRLSISVAALSVSLSMMVAIAVMIGSFRDTVVYWVGQTLKADLFIGPGIRPTVGSEQTVSEDVIATLATHPAGRGARSIPQRRSGLRGQPRGARRRLVRRRPRSRRAAVQESRPTRATQLRKAIGQDTVIISEPFATRYHKRDGDILQIPTPQGVLPFRIAAIYYDYASDRGVVIMDRGTFAKYFGELPPTGVAAYLKPGADPETVRAEMLDMLDEGHRAFIFSNRTLRGEILQVFDSTFAITYALELIAIAVAMLGVAGTLLTLVLERRRELSLLRLTGADRRQVRRMVIIEAALIGAVSQGIGLVGGLRACRWC